MRLSLARRARTRWYLATVCLLAAGGCGGGGGGAPNAPSPLLHLFTFEGSVFEPYSSVTGRSWFATGVTGIPEARVTIIGGRVDGWTTVTDAEGRFAFEDYPLCVLESAECRSRVFRVEKAGYVTVETRASDPHLLDGPGNERYSGYEKHIPMSLEWPTDPQIVAMRRDLPAMDPLWLVEDRQLGSLEAFYGGGRILMGRLEYLVGLAHEYCHAHQDWVEDPDTYGGSEGYWANNTPEGRAFVEAWDTDRPTNDRYLLSLESRRGGRRDVYGEFGAHICEAYFVEGDGTPGRQYLRDRLPHLYAWAEEWLRHR